VHVGACLVHASQDPDDILLIDPAATLLDRWRAQVAAVGMAFLRSPSVHNLDPDPFDLLRFAEAHEELGGFRPPYARPAVPLFDAHCQDVIDRHGLRQRHLRAAVALLDPDDQGVDLTLADGRTLRAGQVVLALGQGPRAAWPGWAQDLVQAAPGRVAHVFDPGGGPRTWADWGRVLVVGAGISGAQASLALARQGRQVTLLSRHPLREHQFDSDPEWLGPKGMEGFRRLPSLAARRRAIDAARHRGSVPDDVRRALQGAISGGHVAWRLGQVQAGHGEADGLRLELRDGTLRVDGVLLATGFAPGRPGGALVDRLVERHALPVAACGAPVVGPDLRWHSRVFVTGALAELELGPVAKNISGARRAASAIAGQLRRARSVRGGGRGLAQAS
jgi:cation diffusion facilitator CzcD-associated flavoprotein CzcO